MDTYFTSSFPSNFEKKNKQKKKTKNYAHGAIIRLNTVCTVCLNYITKTCLYSFDPLKPHFYIVKLGFTGVYIIFLISAQKHRLWVLVRTPRRGGSNEYPQSMF